MQSWTALVVFTTSGPKFGFFPFHTQILREVCRLARLEDETVVSVRGTHTESGTMMMCAAYKVYWAGDVM